MFFLDFVLVLGDRGVVDLVWVFGGWFVMLDCREVGVVGGAGFFRFFVCYALVIGGFCFFSYLGEVIAVVVARGYGGFVFSVVDSI